MKFFTIFFLILSLNFYAQNNSANYKFQFYHDGVFKNKKHIKISVIIEKDTLVCVIKDEEIMLPKTNLKCTILINYKKKNFRIEEVDFSKIDDKTLVTLGLEKHIENFSRISNDHPNLYSIKNTINTLTIENLEQAKEICFISFSSKVQNGKILAVKAYNKNTITINENGTSQP